MNIHAPTAKTKQTKKIEIRRRSSGLNFINGMYNILIQI
jgi:hypothetical protein